MQMTLLPFLIQTFSNTRNLSFYSRYKDENASQKELHKLFSNGLIQLPQESKIKKAKK